MHPPSAGNGQGRCQLLAKECRSSDASSACDVRKYAFHSRKYATFLQVREFVRSAVLCTDMAQHSALSEQLAASRQRHAPPGAAQQAERQQQGGERKRHGQDHPLAGASTPPAAPAVSYSTSDRVLLLRALLHMADLSNPARPLPLGASWGRLVSQEFLAQVGENLQPQRVLEGCLGCLSAAGLLEQELGCGI